MPEMYIIGFHIQWTVAKLFSISAFLLQFPFEFIQTHNQEIDNIDISVWNLFPARIRFRGGGKLRRVFWVFYYNLEYESTYKTAFNTELHSIL